MTSLGRVAGGRYRVGSALADPPKGRVRGRAPYDYDCAGVYPGG